MSDEMTEFRIKANGEDAHDMLLEFGSIEGMLAFVEERGPITISGTIEKPFLKVLREEDGDD